MLERRSIVGNPAQCGECIPNWGEVIGTFHHLEDHEWLKTYFDFPERLRLHRLDNMRVFLPSGSPTTLNWTPLPVIASNSTDTLPTKPSVRELKFGCPPHSSDYKRNARPIVSCWLQRRRYTCDYLIDASGASPMLDVFDTAKIPPSVPKIRCPPSTPRLRVMSPRRSTFPWFGRTVGLCVDHSQRTKLCQRGTGRPCRQA